jgi:hypothetical protein
MILHQPCFQSHHESGLATHHRADGGHPIFLRICILLKPFQGAAKRIPMQLPID